MNIKGNHTTNEDIPMQDSGASGNGNSAMICSYAIVTDLVRLRGQKVSMY